MKSPALRITLAAVIVSLIAVLAVPVMALAADVPEAETPSVEAPTSVEASASADVLADEQTDSEDASAAADPADADASVSRDESQSDATVAVHYASQSSAGTRAAIETLLRARKVQYDKVTTELRRTINRLATDIRLEGAQGGNVAAEKAQLARARAALQRAYVLERAVTARYRAVVTADDQRAQYELAKAAARTSTAQLVTVTKLLRSLVSPAKLVAALLPLRLGADSA